MALKMAFNRPLPDRRPAGTVAGRQATTWKNEEEAKEKLGLVKNKVVGIG
jgi:hypothetical protein